MKTCLSSLRWSARPTTPILPSILSAAALMASALVILLALNVSTARADYPSPGTFLEGGPDQILESHMHLAFTGSAHDVVVDAQGTMYASYNVSDEITKGQIRIQRSTDGGLTWDLWGLIASFNETSFADPTMVLVPGSPERIGIVYRHYDGISGKTMASVTPVGGDTPSWTHAYVFDNDDASYHDPHLAAVNGPNGPVLYAVAWRYEQGEWEGVAFSRSTDAGASWSSELKITDHTVGGFPRRPKVTGDDLGNVLVAYDTQRYDNETDDFGIEYQWAEDFAANANDWTSKVVLAGNNDGVEQTGVEVAAQPDGSGFLLAYSSRPSEGGSTTLRILTKPSPVGFWDVQTYTDDPLMRFESTEVVPSGDGGWVMTGRQTSFAETFDGYTRGFVRADDAVDPDWTAPTVLLDAPYGGGLICRTAIAVDPSRNGRVAMLWTDFGPSQEEDHLLFDAEWLGDPGVPHLQPRAPQEVFPTPRTHPVVVDVTDRVAGDEIIYGDSNGFVRVVDAMGQDLPGWPQPASDFDHGQSLAVGDIDGDGTLEIVAPTADGKVFVFSPDGVLRDGWPVQLGIRPAGVSLAAVSKIPQMDVVVVCGTQVNLLRPDGTPITYDDWPAQLPTLASKPASLADLDDDGDVEVAVTVGTELHVFDSDGSLLFAKGLNGNAPTAPASIGDLDDDGDLELVVPTSAGEIHAMHHDGSSMGGSWPVSVPGAGSVYSVALANVDGAGDLEMAVTRSSGTVALYTGSGTPVFGWPVVSANGFAAPPIIDDINGVMSEVLAADAVDTAHAWEAIPSGLFGWPTGAPGATRLSPATGDVDDDGKLELVLLTTAGIAVYDLGNGPSIDDFVRWTQFGHDPQRTFSTTSGSAGIVTGVESGGAGDPSVRVSFAPPAPNPTSGRAQFLFALPTAAQVRIEMFDVRGRKVATLTEGSRTAGRHAVVWNGRDDGGRDVAAGTYFGRLVVDGAGHEALTRKITVTR